MKNLILIILFISSITNAQSIDYNTKKNFIADGYDVVAYFENKAIMGNKNFITTYDGAKYKFSSQQNLELFIENPQKYIPQYGGYCAYAVAVKSDKVNIDPKTFEIRDNKLYLFYNAWGTNTLNLWLEENPKNLIQKADENWETIKNKK